MIFVEAQFRPCNGGLVTWPACFLCRCSASDSHVVESHVASYAWLQQNVQGQLAADNLCALGT